MLYVNTVETKDQSITQKIWLNGLNYNRFWINSLNYNIVQIKTSNYSYFKLDNS